MDPKSIPAGGVGQVIVRLRRVPVTSTLAVNVDTSANTLNTTIAVNPGVPQLANISFSADLTKIYLYWRRAGGAAPNTVRMDGVDVTADTATVGDAGSNYAMSIVTRPTALTSMSYHVFQGLYGDGATATGGIRAWVNPFVYGSWAAFPIPDGDFAMAQRWLDTCRDRGINTLEMNSGSSGLMDYLGTSGGQAYADSRNYGFIKDDTNWGTWSNNPRMWFIDDEPDCEEANLLNNFCGTGYKLPCGSNQAGTMGMHFISVAEGLRTTKNRPTTINMDGTWKPYSWYAYGQLSDCLAIDHYYQPKVRHAYYDLPNTLPLYKKATVIYATALAGSRAAEPNPSRQLLYSCQLNGDAPVDPWPWAPPETKRIEAYYSLAAGAKGICYWWFKKAPSASNGIGDENLQSQAPALWQEIGLIGAETKLLQPYLVTSHPVDLNVTGSTNVWVKALARGTDTFILFVVTDDYYNDQTFHGAPIPNASVTMALPSWMVSSPTAFEVSRTGLGSVSMSQNGSTLTLALGTLNVAKIVFVTIDPHLRMTLQQRYDQDVWPGICNFASSVCHQNTSPPSFVEHPANRSVAAGDSTLFAIVATGGSPLSYQWQKNGANLSNGGHYAGCTTAMLSISSADSNDVAAYRCVVTSPYGTATSDAATLTLGGASGPTITQQPGAQSVCAGGTATFSVAATGEEPLSYQWQKNSVPLTDGGHYAGCATATLTVSSVDGNDAAGYRCMVSNVGGNTASSQAFLALKAATAITQQPVAQNVCLGTTATFTVAATGDAPLSYQWQKNQANLSNGGRYAGVTTATLTISSADGTDAANYRCVVTAGCGTAASGEAALTTVSCSHACPVNTGFEDGFANGAGIGWGKFFVVGTEGANLVFSDETAEKYLGSHAQEIYSHDVGYDGGVFQRLNTTPGGTYTVSAWFKCYCPEAPTQQVGEGFLGVDSTGGMDPNGATVAWYSAPYLAWSRKSHTFTAAGDQATVFLRGRSTKTPDKLRSAYIWVDQVQMIPAAPTDGVPEALGTTAIRWRWADLVMETGYRVKTTAGADLSGLLASNATQWDETTGILPNTLYTRQVYMVDDCGESGPSAGQSRFALIQTPTGVTIGTVTANSITATPSGTLSNLAVGSSGVRTSNATAGTNSGWLQTQGAWVSSGLAANTQYSFVARARNGEGVETADSPAVSVWTLSVPPGPASVVPDGTSPCVDSPVTWTAAEGFGAGGVQSYRWVFDQSPEHTWTGAETVWSSGTIATAPTAAGAWYLHVQGCNGDGVVNGTYDYMVMARAKTTIEQHPASQDVSAGGTVQFAVAATGDGALVYQWEKDNVPLRDGGHYAGTTTPTLTMSNAGSGDAGEYRCVVTGGCGSVVSDAATLNVTGLAADFDADSDVDLMDFGTFLYCFGGPNAPVTLPGCYIADFDDDGDVDLTDFGVFQSCFNGPNRPPACS